LDQLPALGRKLVSRHPDVLIASPNLFIRALKQETTTIPIVMVGTTEPVRTGFITNLARPEGNVTGVAWFGSDILPKRIELLKEIVPI
jgi:putative ABC transport system substrate-binding protein